MINLINKWERINSSIHSLFNIVDIIYIIGIYLINKGKEIIIKLQSEYNFIVIRKIWEMIFRSRKFKIVYISTGIVLRASCTINSTIIR